MKKFIRGAFAALALLATSSAANASLGICPQCVIVGGQAVDGARYEFWAWDNPISDYVVSADIVSNGTHPEWHFEYPSDVYLGSSKLVDLLSAKANAADLTTLSATVAGIGTPFSGSYTDLTNKPTLFSGAYVDLTGKPTLFSGVYTDLTGKPTLATVATTGAYADLSGKPTIPAAQINSDWNASSGVGQVLNKPSIPTVPASYENTTSRPAFFIYKQSTVASGVAVYQLTADNTSTGTALCSNPIAASVSPVVNDATASYQFGWAFSNSNKTLTVTANKLSTANILTGLLGQTSANGSTVNLSVACY